MARVSALCVIAALTLGCGQSPPGASTDDSSQPEAPSAAPGAAGIAATPAGGNAAIDLPKMSGAPKRNAILELQVTEAGFVNVRPAPAGSRYYVVGLRGISRSDSAETLLGGSKGNDVLIDVRRFVFAQNERGCLARPDFTVTEIPNQFGESVTFSPVEPIEGRLVFLMPDDTARVRVLIAPSGEDGLAVPAGDDFTPAWPAPSHTIEDGSTLRVLVLPRPTPPAALPPPAPGREHVVLDAVVENATSTQGIEFQTSQQLRLVDPDGRFVQASALTKQVGCRLDDGDVIPPGHARRLLVVYDMPAGAPRRLQYRGFEVDEVRVDLP